MPANNVIAVSELGFDAIKTALKNYLRSQSTFADFNFEGSTFNILLDILAYNTHYQTFYLNMVGSEMFLDSALLRNNVVARAREKGYTPTSAQGASASIRLQITPTNNQISTVTVPSGVHFTVPVSNRTLTFVTPEATTISRDANGDFISTVTITEGLPLTHRFSVSGGNTTFTIPNEKVDTRSLLVRVQTSNTDTTNSTYTKAEAINEIGANSKVYFLEEGDNSRYRISFGDNVLGKKPIDGNLVIVDYRVCSGPLGNGANNFTFAFGSIDGHSNVSFTLVSAASGGVNQESIDSIKFNAPKFFSRQDRGVTKTDYERMIKAQFPDLQAVTVWGGEDNDPPRYGRVFIAAKPAIGTVLPNVKKDEIVEFLNTRNVVSIDPIVEDAEFLYIEIDSTVTYNPNLTTLSEGALKSRIQTAIVNWFSTNISDFGEKFRGSKLIQHINNVNAAILGNDTTFRMQMRFTPTTGTNQRVELKFNNAFKDQDVSHEVHVGHVPTVFTQTNFTFNGFESLFKDNGSGGVFIYRETTSGLVTLQSDSGSVDYTTGTFVLDSFNPSAVTNNGIIKVSAIPKSINITPVRNQLIQVDTADISITMEQDES